MDDPTRRVNERTGRSRAAASGTDAASTDSDTNRRTEEIKGEIEQTREDMAETIDAIQDKLRPRNIVANATERVKAATKEGARTMADYAGEAAENVMHHTRDTAGGFMHTIRDNPVPAALVGVGVAWLMTNASRARRDDGWRARRDHSDWSSGGRSTYAEEGRYEQGRSGGLREQVSELGEDLTSGARQFAEGTSDAVRRTGRRAQNQFQRMMNDNPLLVGAGALMLGVAFGLAVPETERENAWMGETRDAVVDRAQQVAGDAASAIQEKATGVADAAGSVAESMSDMERG
jgi:hypothetical protein